MSRSADSFQRPGKKIKAQPLVLVICEDTHSSKTYFEEASKYFRSFAKVEFSHSGNTDPLGIVKAGALRADKFDHVFCVIDRDAHDKKNFDAAVALGNSLPTITVFTSHPCFEVWLLFHFGYSRKPFKAAGNASAGDRVVKELRKIKRMEKYAKGSINGLFESLINELDTACKNGERSLNDAEDEHEPNPSTPLHQLIDELRKLGTVVRV